MKVNLLFLFSFLALTSFGQICFDPHVEYPVGTNTTTKAIATGDFNNDGKLDLAIAIVTPSMVSIDLGNGDGTFTYASSYTIANTQPYAIVSKDFNKDGKLDVAVANNGSALQGMTILLGNGTGGFTTANSYTTTGTNPAAIASADFNSDGNQDVAIANYNSTPGTVTVRMGNGNGTLGAATTYTVGTNPGGIVAADVTGDGKPDLVTSNAGSNNITVLWNISGGGTFQVAGTFSTSPGVGSRGITAVDLNNDNKIDIVTCNQTSSNVSVLLNNNSGQYSSANTYLTATGCWGIVTADFDGDGKPDIATSNYSANNVSVLRGDGAGGLSTPAFNFTTGNSPEKLATGDFNGDGKPDIATSNNYVGFYNASVLLNSLPGPVTVGGNATICNGANTTLTATGADNYSWNTGPTTSSITVNPSTSVSYTVTGTNTGCAVTAVGSKSVTVNQLPLVIANATTTTVTVCTATSVTLTGGGALSYLWSSGISNAVGFMPTSTNTYTVTGTDGNNCSNKAAITISVVPPATPSICLVTVDSLSNHNIIAWEKSGMAVYDSMLIYREISTNNYQQIGSVSFDSLSFFTDTVRAKYAPNTGNPNAGTYRYKIKVRDTCGNFSALSPFHNTIFSTNNNGTFTWPQLYTIEGSPNPVNSYMLMRDDSSTGKWSVINSVAGTQQSVTDPAYNVYKNIASWRIGTLWNINCLVSIKNPDIMTSNLNLSKSNINRVAGPTFVTEGAAAIALNVYPNPTNGKFSVEWNGVMAELELYNAFGEKIKELPVSNKQILIDISSEPKGIYFLKIKTEDGTVVRKIAKQ